MFFFEPWSIWVGFVPTFSCQPLQLRLKKAENGPQFLSPEMGPTMSRWSELCPEIPDPVAIHHSYSNLSLGDTLGQDCQLPPSRGQSQKYIIFFLSASPLLSCSLQTWKPKTEYALWPTHLNHEQCCFSTWTFRHLLDRLSKLDYPIPVGMQQVASCAGVRTEISGPQSWLCHTLTVCPWANCFLLWAPSPSSGDGDNETSPWVIQVTHSEPCWHMVSNSTKYL